MILANPPDFPMFNQSRLARRTATATVTVQWFRPNLEVLDERTASAVFTVTLTTDTGPTTSTTLPLGPGTPGDLHATPSSRPI